jgi:tRNA pseudouridine13 synthase
MRLKAIPEDFVVVEKILLPLVGQISNLPHTAHAIYRVEKRDVTTLQVQEALSAKLHVGKERIAFPALKDKDAIATQFVSIAVAKSSSPLGDIIPNPKSQIEGDGFRAEFVGFAERALQSADLRGNAFTIVVRDLSLDEAQHIAPRLQQLSEFGLPNYFDEQRFGSYSDEGFIGKKILQRDAEGALKIYLAQKMVGDPERVRVFKEFAAAHWGDWAALMERAPKPSNFRSVLTYLKDHPTDGWRKALNLIPHRLLTLYLSAYQSWLWNRIVGQYIAAMLAEAKFATKTLRVAGCDLPYYLNLPEALRQKFERMQVPLPNHRAIYNDPLGFQNPKGLSLLEKAVNDTLAQEQLTLNDFKARILKKAFATKSSRPLIVRPQEVSVGEPENDELARKRWKVTLKFVLPPGSYATLVVKGI